MNRNTFFFFFHSANKQTNRRTVGPGYRVPALRAEARPCGHDTSPLPPEAEGPLVPVSDLAPGTARIQGLGALGLHSGSDRRPLQALPPAFGGLPGQDAVAAAAVCDGLRRRAQPSSRALRLPGLRRVGSQVPPERVGERLLRCLLTPPEKH